MVSAWTQTHKPRRWEHTDEKNQNNITNYTIWLWWAATDCVQVCSLVFSSVARVAERLVASRMLTQIGFLPSVATQVDLQVFKSGKSLAAAFKLWKDKHNMWLKLVPLTDCQLLKKQRFETSLIKLKAVITWGLKCKMQKCEKKKMSLMMPFFN